MRFEEVVPAVRTEHRDGGLHYRRPNKRNWLGGWTVGGASALGAFSGDAAGEAKAFLSFWLVGWALGWLYSAGALLWMLAGAESVTASALALTHTLHLGPLKYQRHYKPSALTDMRWREGSGWPAYVHARGSKPSAIMADYGAKTIEFLRGIDRPEAMRLLETLTPALGMRRRAE